MNELVSAQRRTAIAAAARRQIGLSRPSRCVVGVVRIVVLPLLSLRFSTTVEQELDGQVDDRTDGARRRIRPLVNASMVRTSMLMLMLMLTDMSIPPCNVDAIGQR